MSENYNKWVNKIENHFCFRYLPSEMSLEQLTEMMNKAKKEYPNYTEYVFSFGDNESENFCVIGRREENDQDRENRKKFEAEMEKNREKKEYEEYLRLKDKFESKFFDL